MYHILHSLQVSLITDRNNWNAFDFIRRAIVSVNGTLLDLLR